MTEYMYVLVGESEGDYGDFYQRPAYVLAVSGDKAALENVWDNLPRGSAEETRVWRFDEYNMVLIDHSIEEVVVVKKE